MTKPIDIHVRLDDKTFKRYCHFNAFKRQRLWYWPMLIGMVLMTIAAFLLFRGQGNGAAAGVLMGLGIAVPGVSFGLYYIQIAAQIASQGLKDSPAVYSLRVSQDGIRITNDRKKEAPVDLGWEKIWAAFLNGSDIYIYITPQRALILPEGQASVSQDLLWKALKRQMGDSRCIERH